jgi:hypothetical protein
MVRDFALVVPWTTLATSLLMIGGCGGGSGNTPQQGPTIVTTSLPDDTIGSSYSQTIQASGGTAPLYLERYLWVFAAQSRASN